MGVGGCWAQSVKDEVFERFPFVDVAFGPGQIHRLAEFLTQDSLTAQGYFEFEDFSGHLPAKREREFQAWVQISQGCNCVCAYCIVPSDPRPRGQPPPGRAGRRDRGAGRRRRARGDPAGPEREQLRARPADARSGSRFAELLARVDAVAGDRADPLHEPPSQGHARGRDPRPRRAAGALRAHPPAAAVGLEPDPEGDAPHLQPRALPGPGRADPRARPRLRPDHRHHRRLPGRDRGGLRARRSRWSTRSATTAPSRSSSRRAAAPRRPTLPDQVPHPVKRERMGRLVELVQRRARERAQRFVGRTMEVLVEGPSRTDPARLRGRSRHNKTVNFDGTAEPRRAGRGRDQPRPPRPRLSGAERLLSRAA